jgi:hypothetical protein
MGAISCTHISRGEEIYYIYTYAYLMPINKYYLKTIT